MKLPLITEYLSPAEVQGICKLASEEPAPAAPPPLHEDGKPDWGRRAKIVGAGLLGMGAGTAAGFGGMHLANKAFGPSGIPHSALNVAVPVLGGAAGLAYSLYKAKEMEEIKRAVKPRNDDEPPAQ